MTAHNSMVAWVVALPSSGHTGQRLTPRGRATHMPLQAVSAVARRQGQGVRTPRSLDALPRSWGSVVALVVTPRIFLRASTRLPERTPCPRPVAPRALLAGADAVQGGFSARVGPEQRAYSHDRHTVGRHA